MAAWNHNLTSKTILSINNKIACGRGTQGTESEFVEKRYRNNEEFQVPIKRLLSLSKIKIITSTIWLRMTTKQTQDGGVYSTST